MDKHKICVVASSLDAATLLTQDLQRHNYRAVPAQSYEEAFELCSRETVDLLLLDDDAEAQAAQQLCERLHRFPANGSLPIVFLGSNGESTVSAMAEEDIALRPYNLPFLMVKIDSALRSQAALQGQVVVDSVQDNSYTDHLTGLRNRRYLLERLEEEIDKARRFDYDCACAMIDIDDVAPLDGEVGSASLDELLAELALLLRSCSRTYDVVARYDGTLFAAILPHTGLEEARQYARRLVDELDSAVCCEPTFPTRMTLSIGLVGWSSHREHRHADEVLGEAMRTLFQAKARADTSVVARAL